MYTSIQHNTSRNTCGERSETLLHKTGKTREDAQARRTSDEVGHVERHLVDVCVADESAYARTGMKKKTY
jgi:hypothetical protein